MIYNDSFDSAEDRGWKIDDRKILSSIIDPQSATLTNMTPRVIGTADQGAARFHAAA